jgi:hypothetical protein
MSKDEARTNRALWVTVVACVVVVGFVIPTLTPRQLDVLKVAVWGDAMSLLAGVVGACLWIIWRHGLPFGLRDVGLERTSPYLRESRRWALLVSMGMVVAGLAASAFAVSWYPNPHPDVGRLESPEEYALGVLVGAWLLLLLGTYWLVLEIYWFRVLSRPQKGG